MLPLTYSKPEMTGVVSGSAHHRDAAAAQRDARMVGFQLSQTTAPPGCM
jgi:hypothetical protein